MYNLVKAHSMVDYVEPEDSTINNVSVEVFSSLEECITAVKEKIEDHHSELFDQFLEDGLETFEDEDGYEDEREELEEQFEECYCARVEEDLKFNEADIIKYAGQSQYNSADFCDEVEFYIQKI